MLNIAAKSVVGVAYEGSDIAERAMRYMRMKRIQKDHNEVALDGFLSANG